LALCRTELSTQKGEKGVWGTFSILKKREEGPNQAKISISKSERKKSQGTPRKKRGKEEEALRRIDDTLRGGKKGKKGELCRGTLPQVSGGHKERMGGRRKNRRGVLKPDNKKGSEIVYRKEGGGGG